jgi:hypothetical protein
MVPRKHWIFNTISYFNVQPALKTSDRNIGEILSSIHWKFPQWSLLISFTLEEVTHFCSLALNTSLINYDNHLFLISLLYMSISIHLLIHAVQQSIHYQLVTYFIFKAMCSTQDIKKLEATDQKNIFSKDTSDKGLLFKIYKELFKVKTVKTYIFKNCTYTYTLFLNPYLITPSSVLLPVFIGCFFSAYWESHFLASLHVSDLLVDVDIVNVKAIIWIFVLP